MKARRDRDRVLDQRGAIGNAGHALAHIVEFARRIARFQQGIGFRVVADGDTENLGHGIGGDVVMGGADAAGGEDQVVAGRRAFSPATISSSLSATTRISSRSMPSARQETGDGVGIAVLGAAGEDFVPDHQHRGGLVGLSVWHGLLVFHIIRGLENQREFA